jgi:hypothetical protein
LALKNDMETREETYQEHRERDESTWGGIFLLTWLFPGMRWILVPLAIAVGGSWIINVMGDSGALIREEHNVTRYYSNVDSSGKSFLTTGCRQERKLPDGTCDHSIDIQTISRNFPFFGDAQQVPKK